jgi:hypothetical protein
VWNFARLSPFLLCIYAIIIYFSLFFLLIVYLQSSSKGITQAVMPLLVSQNISLQRGLRADRFLREFI